LRKRELAMSEDEIKRTKREIVYAEKIERGLII